LKALLELYSSNVLRLNGDLIVKNVELIEIVKLATDADDVIIELDFEVNCCGSDKGLNYLKRINCVHKGATTDFRYNYNIQFNILRKYRVSLDITHD
jgi:IS5 family transposase